MLTVPPILSISVIIPVLDEAAELPATLAALGRSAAEGPERAVEVIVADGGSRDATREIAAAWGARVVSSPPGRGSQMNAGATAAGGEILLFLHADTRLPTGWQNQVRAVLSRPGVAAGAFRLGIAGRHPGLRLVEWGANLRSRLWGLPYGDQAIFLPTAIFRRLGGYRPWPLFEEVELLGRLRSCGRLALAPVAVSTSQRRWQSGGMVAVTLRNQFLLLAYYLGVGPERLARLYRHREGGGNGRRS